MLRYVNSVLSAGGIAVLLAVACPAGAAGRQQATPAPIVITNVSVLPMDRERVLAGQTVVVEDGRISRMGRAGTVPIPAGARTVDGAGKYRSEERRVGKEGRSRWSP